MGMESWVCDVLVRVGGAGDSLLCTRAVGSRAAAAAVAMPLLSCGSRL